MKQLIASIIMVLISQQISRACTAFCLCSENRAILAKNLDWSVDAGLILVNHDRIQKVSFNSNGKGISWISVYKSITFNQFGKEFPLGGMNEKGLVVEELNMPAVPADPFLSKIRLNEFQIVQYLLDSFSSLEEIVTAMDQIQMEPLFLSLHYLIMDRGGNSMIMEYDGARFVFFHTDQAGFPVLSNNLYPESLRYLGMFKGFGGTREVLPRTGSNERFVSVASMLSEETVKLPVERSFEILAAVGQPDTRWSIVYDATRLTIHFKFHDCRETGEINLEKIFAKDQGYTLGADISDCLLQDPVSFQPLTQMKNGSLLYKVLKLLGQEMDLKPGEELIASLISFSNRYVIEN